MKFSMQIFANIVDEFHAEYLQLLVMKKIISIHDLLQSVDEEFHGFPASLKWNSMDCLQVLI